MGRRDFFRENKIKKIVTTSMLTLLLVSIAFVTIFVMYSKSMDEKAKDELLALKDDEQVLPNDETVLSSFSQDKTVENSVKTQENKINVDVKNDNNTKKDKSVSKKAIDSVVKEEEKIKKIVENPELKFMAPVSGEIIKDYAMDTLIYSETLKEWCTHNGIDIKAEKTTVVVASERGKVESIKNDPRYGLTVIIEHENGFKTIYSNLLTAEFVTVGENVEKGQTIATVGDSASFEILDIPHLHFEMYKDGVIVNPTIYLNN